MRFKGFEGEWDVRKLGEVIEFKAGYAFKSDQMLTGKSKYQLIKMSNVYKNELRLDRNPSFWGAIDFKQNEFLLKKGDTILTLTGTVGKQDFGYSVQINEDDKYLLNQRLVLLRAKKEKTTNDFIRHLVSHNKFLYAFFGEAKGGTGNQTNVGIEDVKNILFFFPSLREQQKIAICLNAICQRIATQIKIINDLRLLKSTLIKKIFSQQLTFKDTHGNSHPEWQVKELGDVTTLVNKRNKSNEKLPVYSINNKAGFSPQNEQFDGIDSSDRGYDIKLYKVIDKNTFAYNPARINVGSIGYSKDLENIIISSLYVCFKTTDSINDKFLFQYLKTEIFNKEVLKNVEGGVRDYLFYENFARIKLSLPCIDEQEKIADFLSTLDIKIDIEINLLQQLENQKKYLLHSLFI